MHEQESVRNLLGAAFGLLSHARVRAIDLGNCEIILLSAMEAVSPGIKAKLRRLSPPSEIEPSAYAKRQSRRIAKINPVKSKTVNGRKTNRLS